MQADFIIQRMKESFPEILRYAPDNQRKAIQDKYDTIASAYHGMYPLVDYINFKGKGTSESERYNGHGWGLLQALQEMRPVPSRPKGEANTRAINEFARATAFVLNRRVRNSNPARREHRFLKGWMNRIATYRKQGRRSAADKSTMPEIDENQAISIEEVNDAK